MDYNPFSLPGDYQILILIILDILSRLMNVIVVKLIR